MTRLLRNIISGAGSIASVYPPDRRVRIESNVRFATSDAIGKHVQRVGRDFRIAVKVISDGEK